MKNCSRNVLLLILIAAALVAVSVPPATAYAAEGEWSPTGDAYYNAAEDSYVLTEDAQDKRGGIWLNDFLGSDFTLEFDYYTGFNPTHGKVGWDPTGADGIRVSFFLPEGFTLADVEEYLLGGGDLGYSGPGYGVELDTFYNPELNDPTEANHIALMKDGADNHLTWVALPQSEDYEWHHLKIVVAGDSCSAYVDETEMFTYTGVTATKSGLLGITGATGDDTNKHAVKNIMLEAAAPAAAATAAPAPMPAPMPAADLTAKPTASAVLVNGENVAFDAYNIEGNNYFKLRDLAYVLNGSAKQFEVGFDSAANAINLVSGQAYTPNGSEMQAANAGEKAPAATTSKILLDGAEIELAAYNIGGNNYFKLRDIGLTFDFSVTWDSVGNTIVIDTGKGYTAE